MPWDISDYNLNKLGNKSNKEINVEYNRMKKMISRRLITFEKHGVKNALHIRNIRDVIKGNNNRRDREHAIMEMKRFLYLDTSTYKNYYKARKDAIETWRNLHGLEIEEDEETMNTFFDFLEWIRSFFPIKYEVNSVKQSWELSGGNIEQAKKLYEERVDKKIE